MFPSAYTMRFPLNVPLVFNICFLKLISPLPMVMASCKCVTMVFFCYFTDMSFISIAMVGLVGHGW